MSFYRYRDSEDCAKAWISQYDFQNMDYGNPEVNEFVKTMGTPWFMNYHLMDEKYLGDETRISILGANPFKLVVYHFSDGDMFGLRDMNNEERTKCIKRNSNIAEYARYLYNNVYTPEHMAKRLAPIIKERMKDVLEFRAKHERDEYLMHPERWTSDEKVEKWLNAVNYIEFVDPDYMYDDDGRYYRMGKRNADIVHQMEKVFNDEDWKLAEKRYREKYGVKGKRFSK